MLCPVNGISPCLCSDEEGDTSVADTEMSSFTSTPRDLNPVLASPDLPGPSGLSQSSRDIPLSALPPKKRVQRRLDMTQGPQDTTPTVTETGVRVCVCVRARTDVFGNLGDGPSLSHTCF